MSDLKQIWQPIELLTVKNRLLLIRLENKVNSLHLDPQWEKVMGDGQILFEFNPGEAKEFELIGTVKECMENPALLETILETTPKFEESWEVPRDLTGWEKVTFVDANNKPYKLMNKDCNYRREVGKNYIHYGLPADVRDDLPLSSAVDSFTTLLRPKGIYAYTEDYIILKHKTYVPTA